MSNDAFFLGLPEGFENKCHVYPPLIKDMVGDNGKKFYMYKKIITVSQEELEDEYIKKTDKVPTPLEYVLGNSYHDKNFENLAREAFKFFLKEEVYFLYEEKTILIGNIEEMSMDLDNLRFITEDDYFNFQNLVREACGEKKIEPPVVDEDPRVRKMKAKARYRDRVKAKNGGGISFSTMLTAICCMGIGINPLNIGEMSYCAASQIMSVYQEKEHYETDIQMICAGGDSKKINPKYWIRNLE